VIELPGAWAAQLAASLSGLEGGEGDYVDARGEGVGVFGGGHDSHEGGAAGYRCQRSARPEGRPSQERWTVS
jgi:hypothetical protein